MNSGDGIRVVHPLFQEEGDGSIPISPLQLEIQEMPLDTAISLNRLWHRTQPEGASGSFAFGAFFANRYYAIGLWGIPLARKLNDRGMLELRRMAIGPDAPKNTGSRMLRIMRLLIRKKHPEAKRLISYQDLAHHNGPLYKSAGWKPVPVNIPASGWSSRTRDRSKPNPDTSRSEKIRWEIGA